MTASAWFASVNLDPVLCGRLCMTLAHSLWQVGLLAVVATLICRLSKHDKPERDYAVYVTALLVGLAALPITFAMIDVPTPLIAVTDPTAAVAESQVAPLPAKLQPGQAVESILSIPMQRAIPEFGVEIQEQPSAGSWLDRMAPWLAGCYAAGVLVMLLRLVRGIWKSHQLAAHATLITTGPLHELLHTLARTWSLRMVPAMAQAQGIVVPQVVGLLRPTILLPTSALLGLTPEELEMILAHELAHVRRYDMWVSLVQRLAETVLFFNPGLWYLSRRISTYREYCCDEQTCRVASREPSAVRLCYAQALMHVVELSGKTFPHAELTALAATGSRPSELRRRVARLFGEPLREPVRISRGGLLVLIVGLALLLVGPVTWQTAAEPANESKSELTDAPQESSSESKVEVVAIGTHDEELQRWWNAEGKLLESVPFTWKKAGSVTTSDKVWRRIVIRIDTPDRDRVDTDMQWHIQGSRGSAGGNLTFNSEHKPGTYLTRYFSLPKGKQNFGLRVGIAQGDWKRIVHADRHGKAAGLAGKKGVVFSAAIPTAEGTTVVVSHNFFDQPFRIVAVDKTGKTHDTAGHGGYSAGQIYQSPATFRSLSPDQIEHFEFQTREYEWTEIKDLPVEPGEKVAVKSGKSFSAIKELNQLALQEDAGVRILFDEFTASNSPWLPQVTGQANSQSYQILSKQQLWQAMQEQFDVQAGYKDAFAGVLEGFELDPYGPQLDLENIFKEHLGHRLFAHEADGSFFYAWSTKNEDEVISDLSRFARSDPTAKMTRIGDITVWTFGAKDRSAAAVCVNNGYLMVASDMKLLEKALAWQEMSK